MIIFPTVFKQFQHCVITSSNFATVTFHSFQNVPASCELSLNQWIINFENVPLNEDTSFVGIYALRPLKLKLESSIMHPTPNQRFGILA